MTHVRRHQRVTRGRAVSVRAHERSVPVSRGADTVWDDGSWEDRGGYYDDDGYWVDTPPADPDSDPADPPPGDPVRDQMREWRARGEPPALGPEPMTPQMSKLMGCDTPEGRERYERLRAYREAGYTGPLDQDGRIPDPDDPANNRWLGAFRQPAPARELAATKDSDKARAVRAARPTAGPAAPVTRRQWRAMPEADRAAAVAGLRQARDHLERVTELDRQAGRNWETEAYLDANEAVARAESRVPWWRR